MGRGWDRTTDPDRRAGREPVAVLVAGAPGADGPVADPLRSPDTRARAVAGLFFVIPAVCLAGLWLGVQPSGRADLDRWTVALNLGCLALAPAVRRHGARWPVLEHLERALAGAGAAHPVALVVGDLDHFELVNDFGHARSDELLTAWPAPSSTRSDRPAGGTAGWRGVRRRARRPRRGRRAGPGGSSGRGPTALPGLPGEVTMSFGVCVARAPAPPAAVLDRADQALSDAKRNGRDRAVLAR